MNYDLIVIGSGPGGYVAAIRASQLGMKVAVVEKESLGGICLNWGCIPTKALLKSAQVFNYMKKAAEYGIKLDHTPEVDFSSIVKRSRDVAAGMSNGIAYLFKKNKKNLSILDIGTGSGCIAIALAKRLPTSHISACDVSRDALILAGENAKNLKLNIDFFNLDILKSDSWINACVYDVIISNPPYVTNSEKAAMQPNVLNWEPSLALFVNDDDPLMYYRKTLQFCINHLKSSGTVFFEINQHFGNELYDLLSSSGFKDIIIKKDLSGNDRMLSAVKLQQ